MHCFSECAYTCQCEVRDSDADMSKIRKRRTIQMQSLSSAIPTLFERWRVVIRLMISNYPNPGSIKQSAVRVHGHPRCTSH
jgi:hypothetical protein